MSLRLENYAIISRWASSGKFLYPARKVEGLKVLCPATGRPASRSGLEIPRCSAKGMRGLGHPWDLSAPGSHDLQPLGQSPTDVIGSF